MPGNSVGIVGYGKIGNYVAEKIRSSEDVEISYILEPDTGKHESIPDELLVTDAGALGDRPVDLVIEAATFEAVRSVGEATLESGDLFTLSLTALADPEFKADLIEVARSNASTIFAPHGAVLGLDGIQDAAETLDDIGITTWKNPENIDFSYSDRFDPGDVDGKTVLFDGPTRDICAEFPRNVNSHAIVALAGHGFEGTRSVLVADPDTNEATHTIEATGDGTTLEITRKTLISGVTGEYTLASVWGSIRRVLDDAPALEVI